MSVQETLDLYVQVEETIALASQQLQDVQEEIEELQNLVKEAS